MAYAKPSCKPRRWQQAWREAVRDPRELLALLGLREVALGVSDAAAAQFPMRVPRGFVARMRHGDPHDPLLRQVLAAGLLERVARRAPPDAAAALCAAARVGKGRAWVPYVPCSEAVARGFIAAAHQRIHQKPI